MFLVPTQQRSNFLCAAQQRHLAAVVFFLLVATLFLGSVQQAEARGAKLSKEHKKWLEEEVVYIISDAEKESFVKLTSVIERERFIQEFWELRDPTPGTPENEFKKEHYRRIDYANRYFAIGSGKEGWRTDRGRIYIQLGPPTQRAQYPWLQDIRPVEWWFYSQNQFFGLPNAFYLVFFQPSDVGDYVLYSPYLDGPTKLVKTSGSENNPAAVYRYLRSIDVELANASLSLRTDEPLDLENFTASLASDSLLTRIRNLPNDKFTKQMLERRRRMRELVETRIIYEPTELDILAVPLRDITGESYVHFLLQLPDTLDGMLGNNKEEFLAATVNVLVRTAAGERLYQQTHRHQFRFTDAELKSQRTLPVGYEDRLPLPPGDYQIDFIFRNELTQILYQGRQQVQVPDWNSRELWVSPLMVYEEVHRPSQGQAIFPFEFSDLKFVPTLRRQFALGHDLSIFFQIVAPGTGPNAPQGEVLQIHYDLGSLASGGYRRSLTEHIEKRQFSAHGTVIHGKSFPLREVSAGVYRLAIKVADPTTGRRTSRTLSFRVGSAAPESKRVNLFNGQFANDREAGKIDYRRGVCAAANRRMQEAIKHFENALLRNPGLHEARNRLAGLHFEEDRFEQVAALLPPEGLNIQTDLDTARRFVTSFEKLGDLSEALALTERALVLYGPQIPLYQDLLRLYQKTGQVPQAEEVRQQIEQLRHAGRQKASKMD